MCHARPIFFFIFVLSIQLTLNICSINFADDWIRTADLWYRKRPLYQLSHNHCPAYRFVWARKTSTTQTWRLSWWKTWFPTWRSWKWRLRPWLKNPAKTVLPLCQMRRSRGLTMRSDWLVDCTKISKCFCKLSWWPPEIREVHRKTDLWQCCSKSNGTTSTPTRRTMSRFRTWTLMFRQMTSLGCLREASLNLMQRTANASGWSILQNEEHW